MLKIKMRFNRNDYIFLFLGLNRVQLNQNNINLFLKDRFSLDYKVTEKKKSIV